MTAPTLDHHAAAEPAERAEQALARTPEPPAPQENQQ